MAKKIFKVAKTAVGGLIGGGSGGNLPLAIAMSGKKKKAAPAAAATPPAKPAWTPVISPLGGGVKRPGTGSTILSDRLGG